MKLGGSEAGCKKQCEKKDSGVAMTGAEACYNDCKEAGKSAEDCKKKCYPDKTGK